MRMHELRQCGASFTCGRHLRPRPAPCHTHPAPQVIFHLQRHVLPPMLPPLQQLLHDAPPPARAPRLLQGDQELPDEVWQAGPGLMTPASAAAGVTAVLLLLLREWRCCWCCFLR